MTPVFPGPLLLHSLLLAQARPQPSAHLASLEAAALDVALGLARAATRSSWVPQEAERA